MPVQLKQIDLGKCQTTKDGALIHPDIKMDGTEYLLLRNGHWEVGPFVLERFGLTMNVTMFWVRLSQMLGSKLYELPEGVNK